MKKYLSLLLILALLNLLACEEDQPVNPKIQTEDVVVTSGASFTGVVNR